jgi:hypothetical protein
MHFSTKNYLKSNRYHTAKHTSLLWVLINKLEEGKVDNKQV